MDSARGPGAQAQGAQLRHDQQFAVGVVEEAFGHVLVAGIDMDTAAGLGAGVAIDRDGGKTIDEVGGRLGQGSRVPAHLVGVRGGT